MKRMIIAALLLLTAAVGSSAQSQPFTFRGVHAGATVAEVNAASTRYRGNEMQCVDNYGGPNHDTPAVECAFETEAGGVKLFFFRSACSG